MYCEVLSIDDILCAFQISCFGPYSVCFCTVLYVLEICLSYLCNIIEKLLVDVDQEPPTSDAEVFVQTCKRDMVSVVFVVI